MPDLSVYIHIYAHVYTCTHIYLVVHERINCIVYLCIYLVEN